MINASFRPFSLIAFLWLSTFSPAKADDEYFTHNRATFSGTLTSSDSYVDVQDVVIPAENLSPHQAE